MKTVWNITEYIYNKELDTGSQPVIEKNRQKMKMKLKYMEYTLLSANNMHFVSLKGNKKVIHVIIYFAFTSRSPSCTKVGKTQIVILQDIDPDTFGF